MHTEELEFDVRLVSKFKEDEDYMKRYQEYLNNLKDHSYNIQEVEI